MSDNKIISVNVLKYTRRQLIDLSKKNDLEILGINNEDAWFIENLINQTDKSNTAILGMFLHASLKHLSSFAEVYISENKYAIVELHIFTFSVPPKPEEPLKIEEVRE